MSTLSQKYLSAFYEEVQQKNFFIKQYYNSLSIENTDTNSLTFEQFAVCFDNRLIPIKSVDLLNLKDFVISYYINAEKEEKTNILENLNYYMEKYKINILNFLSITHKNKEEFLEALKTIEYKYMGVIEKELNNLKEVLIQKGCSDQEIIKTYHSFFYKKRNAPIKTKNEVINFILKNFSNNIDDFLDTYPQINDRIHGLSFNLKEFVVSPKQSIICFFDIEKLEKKFCNPLFTNRRISSAINELSQVIKDKFNLQKFLSQETGAFEGKYMLEVRLYHEGQLNEEQYLGFIEKYLLNCHNQCKEKQDNSTATIWLEKEILNQSLVEQKHSKKNINKL